MPSPARGGDVAAALARLERYSPWPYLQYQADLALVAQALAEGKRDADRLVGVRGHLAFAIFWLLRAYESGHRDGWEPGQSSTETMDGLHTWLADLGFDPNETRTPQSVPKILAALLPPTTEPTNGG